MSINIETRNILKQLLNQTSIDSSIIAPSLGVNIKLINSEDPTRFFVGIVTELIASIKNANSAIYAGMKLDGVDNNGVKKTLTLTIDQLIANTYGNEYDTMYYTSSLHDKSSPNIKEENNDDILKNNQTIQIFDNNYVALGKTIFYRKNNGEQAMGGIISGIDPKGENIKITVMVNGRLSTVILTLLEATETDFEAYVIDERTEPY